jgi:3-phenylpropionate/cinnamic acid dioxygenase small subunit
MDEVGVWIRKAEVAELITRYPALTDAGEWEALAALYTEDGRMNRPMAPDDFIAGRCEILKAFRARLPRSARHVVANVLVRLEDDARASATSQLLLFTAQAIGTDSVPVQSAQPPLIGSYHDKLLNTEQGWRFQERRGSLDFSAPAPRVEP